jgi:hypothetical protein
VSVFCNNTVSMPIKISHDASAPAASVEIMIAERLPDYDLLEVEAMIPRDVDPMLASQGFKDLLDEARTFLDAELAGSGLEIAQLTGAICRHQDIHRPGIWLLLREHAAAKNQPMSGSARTRVTEIASKLLNHLQLS